VAWPEEVERVRAAFKAIYYSVQCDYPVHGITRKVTNITMKEELLTKLEEKLARLREVGKDEKEAYYNAGYRDGMWDMYDLVVEALDNL